ncbi:RNA 2'-phosphotransferase [Sphingobacterium sp. KU25419]|nr:RNA 2'-phosphotransferase [Sphingobacterium sp. KU25419]
MTDKYKHISKFLSLILRHRPEVIGITLDEQGWADTTDLIEKINKHNNELDFNTLKQIVDTNPKRGLFLTLPFRRLEQIKVILYLLILD